MRISLKIILLLVFILISFICKIDLNDFFMNTIYTVSGIMFSIGLGLVVTFNLQGIKNKTYIQKIRGNLKEVRNTYIYHFCLSTIYFILDKYFRDIKHSIIDIPISDSIYIQFNLAVFLGLLMFYSIIYFIINFLALQKLNDDIFDKVNE